MPKKLPATNWSKIHEMARTNKLLAKQGGDEHRHQHQHQQISRTSRRVPLDATALNPSILRRQSTLINPDGGILNTNTNDRRGDFTQSSRRKSTTFAAGVAPRGSMGLSDASTIENKTNYTHSYRPYWGVTGTSVNGSSRASTNGLADVLPLCCRPSKEFSEIMIRVARHKAWRTVVAILEAILLVGPQIRDLACPKESDRPFDIIFIIAVVGLYLDIILMSYSTPNYFTFRIHGARTGEERRSSLGSNSNNALSGGGASNVEVVDSNQERLSCRRGFTFGGFIFWLDVISASALLFDITTINPLLTNRRTIHLIHGTVRLRIRLCICACTLCTAQIQTCIYIMIR